MRCCAFQEMHGIQARKDLFGGDAAQSELAIKALVQVGYQMFNAEHTCGGIFFTEVVDWHSDGGIVPVQCAPQIKLLVRNHHFGKVTCQLAPTWNPNEHHAVRWYVWTFSDEQTDRFKAWSASNIWPKCNDFTRKCGYVRNRAEVSIYNQLVFGAQNST